MSVAISLVISQLEIEDLNVKLQLSVFFYDVPLGVKESQAVYVYFPPTANPNAIENAIEDAIIEGAKNYYPTMVLGRGDIIMLDIKRGS